MMKEVMSNGDPKGRAGPVVTVIWGGQESQPKSPLPPKYSYAINLSSDPP